MSQAGHIQFLPPPIDVNFAAEPEHPCPYLPTQRMQSRYFAAVSLPPDLYHRFMDANFRRSGLVFYQPVCPNCQACRQIRVPVQSFTPTNSQRRCRRRNQDLIIAIDAPKPTDEKFNLYTQYVTERHGLSFAESRDGFESFLYASPVHTVEITYRTPQGQLLAVGICDICSLSLSSVYFYFHPKHPRRSLGTFGVLREIALANELGLPYYYLGYWIQACPAMAYKASFRPAQILQPDATWQFLP